MLAHKLAHKLCKCLVPGAEILACLPAGTSSILGPGPGPGPGLLANNQWMRLCNHLTLLGASLALYARAAIETN